MMLVDVERRLWFRCAHNKFYYNYLQELILLSQVRKDKKEDQLNKRRSMPTEQNAADLSVFTTMTATAARGGAPQQSVISAEIIAENVRDLHSDNPAIQLKATQQFRRFLSIGKLRRTPF